MTLNYDLELVRKKCDELRDAAMSLLGRRPCIPLRIGRKLVEIRPVAAELAEAIAEYQKGTSK